MPDRFEIPRLILLLLLLLLLLCPKDATICCYEMSDKILSTPKYSIPLILNSIISPSSTPSLQIILSPPVYNF